MGSALRELSLLLMNHQWLPLAYHSHCTWLPRTSCTGSNLPLQLLLLLLVLLLKLLSTLQPIEDFPVSVPLSCCPSAWHASSSLSPADRNLACSSRLIFSVCSSLKPSDCPALLCSCSSGIFPDTLSTCVCLVQSYLPLCLSSLPRLWLLNGRDCIVLTFYLCTPTGLSTPFKALISVISEGNMGTENKSFRCSKEVEVPS